MRFSVFPNSSLLACHLPCTLNCQGKPIFTNYACGHINVPFLGEFVCHWISPCLCHHRAVAIYSHSWLIRSKLRKKPLSFLTCAHFCFETWLVYSCFFFLNLYQLFWFKPGFTGLYSTSSPVFSMVVIILFSFVLQAICSLQRTQIWKSSWSQKEPWFQSVEKMWRPNAQ